MAANERARQHGSSRCGAWNWRQQNGALRDTVCRSMMLMVHRGGHIELPPVRRPTVNHVIQRRRPPALPADFDRTPIESSLAELGVVEWRQVRRTTDEALFDALIAEHHYLRPVRLVGEHLKFLALAQGRPVACFAWSSPPHKLNPRDQFIGWSRAARDRNRHLIAYNLDGGQDGRLRPRRVVAARRCAAAGRSRRRPRDS